MKSGINACTTALFAGAMLLSISAMASPLSDRALTGTETVKYDRAKAATSAGAAELYQKLLAAAGKACSTDGTRLRASDVVDSTAECTTRALNKAVARISSPALTALHVQNTAKKSMPAEKEATAVASR